MAMDGWTIGTDIATMLTGLSVLTATIVWTRTQWRDWSQRKAAIAQRNWHGYVMPEGISDWYVRLVEDPKTPTATVILNVVDRDGTPDASRAENLRQTIIGDGMLARVPTPEEYDFLRAQRKERGYGKGFPVR
jgi:hypothetical protein